MTNVIGNPLDTEQDVVNRDYRGIYQHRYSEATTQLRQVEMDWSKTVNSVDGFISSQFEAAWPHFMTYWRFQEVQKPQCRQHTEPKVRSQVLGFDAVFSQICGELQRAGQDCNELTVDKSKEWFDYVFRWAHDVIKPDIRRCSKIDSEKEKELHDFRYGMNMRTRKGQDPKQQDTDQLSNLLLTRSDIWADVDTNLCSLERLADSFSNIIATAQTSRRCSRQDLDLIIKKFALRWRLAEVKTWVDDIDDQRAYLEQSGAFENVEYGGSVERLRNDFPIIKSNLQMFEDELDQLGPHNEEMLVSRLHQGVDLIEVLRGSVLPYIGGFDPSGPQNQRIQNPDAELTTARDLLLQHCIAESQNETDPSDICIRRVHALQDFVNEFGTALPNLARIVADHNEEFLAVLDGDTTLQQWTAEFVSGQSLQGCHKEVCDYRATIQRPDSENLEMNRKVLALEILTGRDSGLRRDLLQ